MKFLITMHMPVRTKPPNTPQPVHQVIAEHSSQSLDELSKHLNANDFILVEEFYKDDSGYFSTGHMILNTSHVGKVKVLT